VNRAGGQTGSFVNNVLSAQNTNAINDFSVADANLTRQNRNAALSRQYGALGQIQNVDNMNNQNDLNYRLMQEQALGGAIAQQKQNISGMWSGIAGLGGTVAGYGLNQFMNRPAASGGGFQDQTDRYGAGSMSGLNAPTSYFGNGSGGVGASAPTWDGYTDVDPWNFGVSQEDSYMPTASGGKGSYDQYGNIIW
jgi:hypothetical protein